MVPPLCIHLLSFKGEQKFLGFLWRGCTVGVAVKFNKCKTHSILQILQKKSTEEFSPFSLGDFPNSISANALSNRMPNIIQLKASADNELVPNEVLPKLNSICVCQTKEIEPQIYYAVM